MLSALSALLAAEADADADAAGEKIDADNFPRLWEMAVSYQRWEAMKDAIAARRPTFDLSKSLLQDHLANEVAARLRAGPVSPEAATLRALRVNPHNRTVTYVTVPYRVDTADVGRGRVGMFADVPATMLGEPPRMANGHATNVRICNAVTGTGTGTGSNHGLEACSWLPGGAAMFKIPALSSSTFTGVTLLMRFGDRQTHRSLTRDGNGRTLYLQRHLDIEDVDVAGVEWDARESESDAGRRCCYLQGCTKTRPSLKNHECKGCNIATYCDDECARADRARHRPFCASVSKHV